MKFINCGGSKNNMRLKILTTNHHSSYLYLLSHTGHEFHVIDYEGWGKIQQRPVPSNVILYPSNIYVNMCDFDCVIGHKPFHDLMTFGIRAMMRKVPYIQVIHGWRQRTGYRRSLLRRFLKAVYGTTILAIASRSLLFHLVFISDMARASWGLPGSVIYPGIPIKEFKKYAGTDKRLLIVGNNLHREHFDFEALMFAAKDLPIRIIGVNPKIPGSEIVSSWDALKEAYSRCRAYLNLTRIPEDGYNLATLEAMATGMPVLTLRHPTSPIVDRYNGLVANDRFELVAKGRWLLQDHDLARALGLNALRTVEERFNIERFVNDWNRLLFNVVWGERG